MSVFPDCHLREIINLQTFNYLNGGKMHVINNYIVLVSAIKEMRFVTFNYDGLDRVVECATLGYTTAGMPAIRGYQPAGDTHSGTVPCWRLFRIDKIQGLVLTEEHFYSEPPFYKKSDPAFSRIDAEL